MAERYTRLFTISQTDLYETGSPLLICAGALLKDMQTGRMIAQLKFRNIGIKRIAAVKISVHAFDAFGTEVEGVPEFQYLDLSIPRDREFGQKTPIVLPNTETRSFSCACKSVIFADGARWESETDEWQPLTKQKTIESRLGGLAEQYRRDTRFPSANYAVTEDRDLWLCVCGAINHREEIACHTCNAKREELKAAENPELLKEHDEAYRCRLAEQAEAARIEMERKAEEARIEAERKAEEARIKKEKAARKRRKVLAITLPILGVCISLGTLLLFLVIIPKMKLNKAKELIDSGDYEAGYALLEELGDTEAIASNKNERAAALIESGDYEAAYVLLEELGDTEAIASNKYERVAVLIKSGDYEAAYALLEEMGDTEAIVSNKYERAAALIDSGDYEAAYALLEEMGDTDAIVSNKKERATALIESGDYVAAYALLLQIGDNDAIVSNKYERATALIDSGDYDAAYTLLRQIGDNDAIKSDRYERAAALIDSDNFEAAYIYLKGLHYKDSASKLESIRLQYERILLSRAQVGDFIVFGSYEQDANTANGKEDIQWIVLAKEDSRLLVISRYALDRQPYEETYTYNLRPTWETCSLRKWLNKTFLSDAFHTDELKLIQTATVKADKNPEYSTSPGNNTSDKVFLLSIEEFKTYQGNITACQATPFASRAHSDSSVSEWWLRSPGQDSHFAATIYYNHYIEIHYFGCFMYDNEYVRPAMWIDYE